jgi:cytoskeletal protein RodZ
MGEEGRRAMSGLGEHLRAAREARGLSLAEVARQTHIAQSHLAALEREDYAALPPRVYIEGMVRVYSACLGLDPEIALRHLDAALGPHGAPDILPHLRGLEGGGTALPWSLTAAVLVFVVLVLVGLGLLLWQAEALPAAGDPARPPAQQAAPTTRGPAPPTATEELLFMLRSGAQRD